MTGNARGLSSLSAQQKALVEEFGNIYEGYGLRRLKGLIVGLLLVCDDVVSLDEITTLLGRSKGPISTEVRELAAMGLIHKVEGPVSRKDYYRADPDLFYQNFRFNMATVRRNKQTAERFLARLEATPGPAAMHHNLETMKAFYTLMESFYERFSDAWQARRYELGLLPPDVRSSG